MFYVKYYPFSLEFVNLIGRKMFHVKHVRAYLEFAINISKMKQKNSWSQIGYSQSVLLFAHNLIAAIAAFQWESALLLKQGNPNPSLSPWRLRSGGLP